MTTFYIEQFGCRATQADGAAIERQLRDRGCLAASDSAAADVVVVNTCMEYLDDDAFILVDVLKGYSYTRLIL